MNRWVILGLLGTGMLLGVAAQNAEYGTAPGTVGKHPEMITPTEISESSLSYLQEEEDTFATYVFTLADIIIFAYEDSAQMEVRHQGGGVLWSGLMNEGDYHTLNPGQGVFMVISNKEFSVLIGDPLSDQVQGFAAVDNHNECVAERFFTLQTSSWGGAEFIVFAYEDSTVGEIRDSRSGGVMYNFTLDSAGHFSVPATWAPVEVVANKGVSVLSYGDQGYWVPASNGSFSGQLFFTRRGYIGSWPNDINVCAYSDETHIKITNTETQDVLYEGDLDDGDVYTLAGSPSLIYVTVESNKNVTVLVAPFVSYASAYARLYCGMDATGAGIGNKFYHPTISGGRLDIFSFYDDNQVEVRDMRGNNVVWSGTLESGGHHMLSTMNTLYRVTASRGVALFDEMAERAGAIFAPPWFAVHPDVAVLPDQERTTEPGHEVNFGALVENNGNFYDLIEIYKEHTYPEEFTSDLTDQSGNPLPDADGNGIPDTDTLQKGESFMISADVFPSTQVPFESVDSLILWVKSTTDTTKRDTTFLTTYIRTVTIVVDSNQTRNVYPGDTAVFNVFTASDMRYRELDTMELEATDTKNNPDWPVRLVDSLGNDLVDLDGDGTQDVPGIQKNQVPVPYQVRLGVPDSAMAGDEVVITLTGHSQIFPPEYYPGVEDTAVLTAVIQPDPAIQIRPLHFDSVRAGNTISYQLTVSNGGNGPDSPNITISTNRSNWGHDLVASDSTTPLTDTDGDGTVDVGSIPGPDGDTNFYLSVTPPYSALPGTLDSTIVYATSAVFDTVYDSTIVVTKVKGIISLDIEPDTGMIIGPGEEAVYDLRVTNYGGTTDTVAIGTYPVTDLGWSAQITDSDDNPISNHDAHPEPDLGGVDSAQTVIARVVVRPHESLGSIIGEIDTTITERRYVWIRTCYRHPDSLAANDSVLLTTTFEPYYDIHNYPNPFKGTNGTTFAYSIPRTGRVVLRIYNRAGEYINTLVDEPEHQRGMFEAYWDGKTSQGKTAAPGVYIYTLEWTPEEQEEGLLSSPTKRLIKKALIQP